VAGALMIIVWVLAALIPHLGEYQSLNNQIQEASLKLVDFQQTIRLLPEYVKTRNELARKKAELNSSLYTKENILSLFAKFYALADKNRVDIVEITPPVEELLQINRIVPDSVGLMFLNIGLRIEGDYRDFGQFVSALENETFYRGPNHCNIIGTFDRRIKVQYHVGFKSLLGSLKDEV
jgi:hypothetical protein